MRVLIARLLVNHLSRYSKRYHELLAIHDFFHVRQTQHAFFDLVHQSWGLVVLSVIFCAVFIPLYLLGHPQIWLQPTSKIVLASLELIGPIMLAASRFPPIQRG